MAVLGLRFCARAFSSCGKWGPLFIAVRGPLTIAASLVAEHRLQTRRLSSCGSRARVAPWHVGSSQTRARTRVPCIGRHFLNHCATREARCPGLMSRWQSPRGSQQTSNFKGEVGPSIAVWGPLSLGSPYSLAHIIEIIQCRMCHLQFPGEKCSRGRGICTATMQEACTTGRIFRSKLWVWGRRKGQRKQTGIH